VPAIQVERFGPQGAAALSRGQTDAMKEQAAIAKERDATTEARAHEAAKAAGRSDPWEMAGQVGMAIVYAVATAVAAAAVSEFTESLRVVLERIFGAPAALLRSLRSRA
jgi:hypothetical protein